MGKKPSSHGIVRGSEPIRLLKSPRSLSVYILNVYIYWYGVVAYKQQSHMEVERYNREKGFKTHICALLQNLDLMPFIRGLYFIFSGCLCF